MKRRNWIVGGAVVAAVAALMFAGLSILDVNLGGGGTSAQQIHVGETGNLLITDNRQTLEVCVDFIGVDGTSVAATDAVNNVRAAVQEVAAHPYWSDQAMLSSLTDTANVDLGCPSGMPPSRYQARDPIGSLRPFIVNVPSVYRLFVFIMADGDVSQLVGGFGKQFTAQEGMCVGHTCFEVTTGLYLGIGQANEGVALAPLIERAIGLRN